MAEFGARIYMVTLRSTDGGNVHKQLPLAEGLRKRNSWDIFLTSIFHLSPGAGVGGQRVQGLEGEAYHSPASAVGHPRRRGAGQPHQSHDRWRWCHPAYPQIADRQEEPRIRRWMKLI